MGNHLVTGEWNGFYLEQHRSERGWMHLYLAFENGVIRGEGTDYVGPWVAAGSYESASGDCQWTKQYVGKHLVEYRGQADSNGIQGEWKLPFSSGPFHIWPRAMGHFQEMYLRDELDGVPESQLLGKVAAPDSVEESGEI